MRWSAHIPTRFHVPRRTLDTTKRIYKFIYGGLTLYARLSQAFLLLYTSCHIVVLTPGQVLVWAFPLSLAATYGIEYIFLFL